MAVQALSDEELTHVARAWTANLLEHARALRSRKSARAHVPAVGPGELEDPDDRHGEVAGA